MPTGPSQASTEPNLWSAPVGSWVGVPVRVHVSLAVVIVLAIGACVSSGSSTAWLALAVYLCSLGFHELAHLAASARSRHNPLSRREPVTVVLGPLGGLGVPGAALEQRERVFVAMAGPVANLAIVVAAMCGLAGSGVELVGSLLIDPFVALVDTPDAGAPPIRTLAPLLIAINWPLFLLNLAPSSPFDGGLALRAWLGLWLGTRAARDASCFVALLVAAGLLGAGGALVLAQAATPFAGAGFAALAMVIAFGARADATRPLNETAWAHGIEADLVGLSLSDLPPPGARDPLSDLVRTSTHQTAYADDSDEPYSEDEAEFFEDRWDDGRLDAILAKVHASGMQELTANERAILERASELYQRRRRSNG